MVSKCVQRFSVTFFRKVFFPKNIKESEAPDATRARRTSKCPLIFAYVNLNRNR